MIGLSKRVAIFLGLFVLATILAYQLPDGAQAGKKDEPKKDAKKDEPKQKDDKDKKDEPKPEPFKIDLPVKELKGHKDWIFALTYSGDGKQIGTGSRDGTVKIWDVETGKDIQTLKPHPDREVRGIVFLDGAGKVASSTGKWNKEKKFWEGEIKIWDAKAGKQVGSLKGHGETIEGLALSKDGKFLASFSKDQTVKIWDVAAGKDVQTLKGHTDAIFAGAFSTDGKRLVTASADTTIKLWDPAAGKEILTFAVKKPEPIKKDEPKVEKDKKDKVEPKKDKVEPKKDKVDPKKDKDKMEVKKDVPRPFTAVAFTPDGKKVVAGNMEGVMKILDVDANKEIGELKAHEGVWAIAFNSDGSRMATGGWDKTIKVWDTATWKELFTIKAHEGTVIALAFSPNGQQIASGGTDGVMRLWSATTAPAPKK